MTLIDHDVAVVGGGPVGAACAVALRQAGFSVALVERGAPPLPLHDDPDTGAYDLRVYAITPASMQLLQQLGVWPRIAMRRVSAYAAMQVWVQRSDAALHFAAADVGRAELGWITEHRLLMAALWQALDGVSVLAPAQIEKITLAPDQPPRLQLQDGRQLTARLLVAADGADSELRRAAGIATVGWRYAQRAVVCHVRTERPHQSTARQRFLPSGPLALLPLSDGRCSIVWSADEALATALLALDDDAFRARLSAASGGVLGEILEVTPRLALPLQLLHAQDYARAGVVLVGDAAHAVHPLAGQGVNLGFADVAALVDTLHQANVARRDWASLRTLQRYGRGRKSANLDMLAVTDGLYRLFSAPLPGLRTLLAVGMDGVDQLAPLKRWLALQAIGR